MLIRIDGEPVYEPVVRTELQRVINTDALILRDVAGMHYPRMGDAWLQSPEITDSWSGAGAVPKGAETVLERALADAHINLFHNAGSDRSVQEVCISMTQASLIVTNGEPQYLPFEGTSVLYLSNTSSNVFREPTEQELYVRLPAGWLRAWTPSGPWEPVRDDKLPADLRRSGA